MNSVPDPSETVAAVAELRELSREPDWQNMEDCLATAFARRADAKPVNARSRRWWQWTAAAAIVFLAAAITFYIPASRYGAALPKPQPAGPSNAQPPTPATSEPSRHVTPPAAPSPKQQRRPTRTTAAGLAISPQQQTSASTLNHFVVLPSAYALPDFESGRIMRMEVPMTLLPAYGLELVPDAAPSAVQADFLIGQDGVPRAIRLASTPPR